MHKWHVSAALGRGRPLSDIVNVTDSIALSLRQFHISALRAQDEQPSSSQPSPLSPRRERLQNTTQEIQNLYNRSAARSRYAPYRPPSNLSHRSIKLDASAPPGPAAAIDARALASRPTSAPRPLGAAPALRGRSRVGNSVRGGRAGGRGGRSGGSGRSAREGRGGRAREEREPRRKRGNDGEAARRDDNAVEYTEAEEKYLIDKEREAIGRDVPYQVRDVSQESLVAKGPAVLMGEYGMAEMVEERLRLVARKSMMEGMAGRKDVIRRVLAGEFVRFENEQEKEEVLAEVERIGKRGAELRSEEKGEIVEPRATDFAVLEEAERKALVAALLKGEYTVEEEGAEGLLGHLMRSTSKNETYLPKDGKVLLEKVRTLLPAAQKSRPAATAKVV
ncbi:MAG: hypothetical protein FRX48_00002 [Lasallia pustulata]|uniref:Uncharacterized protein n=1 Tax=Lasallia pustulata TaxID=136370 RepID=A0A5M8Q1M8_9LECA|nr:MAG: hypothetical protein FRX48_00002 [Lasallia pustulata]